MYDSWAILLKNLPVEQAGELIQMICSYRLGEDVTSESDTLSSIFAMIKEQLDSDNEKYEEVCRKRAEYGKRGGKAKATKSNQKVAKESKSKQKQTDNDSDSEYEYDNEYENDNDNEYDSDNESKDNIKKKPTRKTHEQINSEIFNQLVGGYDFSENMRAKVYDWFMYKAEMKKDYKERGAKSLFTEILNNINIYGEQAVIDAINRTMSNGYQGIVWDYCKKTEKNQTNNLWSEWRDS